MPATAGPGRQGNDLDDLLACESVVAIDSVDGSGEIRHASPDENADVYWAARGAGHGFFGVVTRFHLRLYHVVDNMGRTCRGGAPAHSEPHP